VYFVDAVLKCRDKNTFFAILMNDGRCTLKWKHHFSGRCIYLLIRIALEANLR
jgi:hypothetical protein